MKKYETKIILVSSITEVEDANNEMKLAIHQNLVNKVFRIKKRYKNKYGSKASKFFVTKKSQKLYYKRMSKIEKSFLKPNPVFNELDRAKAIELLEKGNGKFSDLKVIGLGTNISYS